MCVCVCLPGSPVPPASQAPPPPTRGASALRSHQHFIALDKKDIPLDPDTRTRTATASASANPGAAQQRAMDVEAILPSFDNQVAGHRGISHEGGAIRKIPTEPGKIAKPVGQVRALALGHRRGASPPSKEPTTTLCHIPDPDPILPTRLIHPSANSQPPEIIAHRMMMLACARVSLHMLHACI